MVRSIIALLLVCGGVVLSAQDVILKRTGEKIYCNIEEITDYYVHFYELEDVEKALLYKMDVALIDKVSFDGSMAIDKGYSSTRAEESNEPEVTYHAVESNIDGLFKKYGALHYQLMRKKYLLDFGMKRYVGREAAFFEILSDKGSMVELGLSIPMKMFASEKRAYRGIYLRGFGIYGRGTFLSAFQNFFIQEYSFAVFGAQGVLAYQLSDHLYMKIYYGLAGTVDIDNFRPGTSQADISASGGIQSTLGLRVGYLF